MAQEAFLQYSRASINVQPETLPAVERTAFTHFRKALGTALALGLPLLAACGGEPPEFAATAPGAERVVLLESAHVYFADGDNRRTLTVGVGLPEASAAYDTVRLTVDLDCPNDRCDWWDRKGSLFVRQGEHDIEMMRFMTPYRVGATWQADVSDLMPLLWGETIFSVFIDTWVGPGHSQGEGWLVNAYLDYSRENRPDHSIAVLPVFDYQSVEYGNPAVPATLSMVLEQHAGVSAARLVSHVTGHGQGNTGNCAEFCAQQHTFSVNGSGTAMAIWRDDCQATLAKGEQQGTWIHARAGWCPGALVEPIRMNVSKPDGRPWQISWTPAAYLNQDREGYNDGSHTMPYYQVSSFLVISAP